jgi:DNA-binding NtrC family response regulator
MASPMNNLALDNKSLIAGFQSEALDILLDKKIFHLFMEYYSLKGDMHFKEFFDKIEHSILLATLSMFGGSQRNAARFLGLKYTTLNEKIKKHHLSFRKELLDGVFPTAQPD